MIGDRWRDIEAGRRAGCATVFDRLRLRTSAASSAARRTTRCGRLPEAAAWILATPDGAGGKRHERRIDDLKVKIFADGADKAGHAGDVPATRCIKGFTTNPTLMRKAGITDYRAFALDILRAIPDRPISFEVFSDEFDEMERQAREIARWGDNVYVKIPVTNTRGEPSVRR